MIHREQVLSEIERHKLFGIVRGVSAKHLARAMETFCEAGIRLVEVTFDRKNGPENTLACLKVLQDTFSDRLIYGAGTVTSTDDVAMAAAAGCQFIVSPDCNPDVIKATRAAGMVSIPAALTPSECLIADRAGADFIKLFPGGLFGPDYVKAVAAPLGDLKFLVVGGVHEGNLASFYKAGAVGFGVGSNLINNTLIINKQFDQLLKTAKSFVAACDSLGE